MKRQLRLSQRCSRKHLISKACPPVADQYSTTPTFRDPPLQPAPPPLPPHYPLVGSFMLPAAPTSSTLGIVMTLARLPCGFSARFLRIFSSFFLLFSPEKCTIAGRRRSECCRVARRRTVWRSATTPAIAEYRRVGNEQYKNIPRSLFFFLRS